MQRQTAQAILRLLAILTIFLGIIMSTCSGITLLGMQNAVQGVPGQIRVQATGMVTQVGLYGVLAWASLLLWGFLLFRASAWLARAIVQDSPVEPAPERRRTPHPRHPRSPRIPKEE